MIFGQPDTPFLRGLYARGAASQWPGGAFGLETKAQEPPIAAPVRLHIGDPVLNACAQVVAGHQLHRGGAEHLCTVQAAAVQQHLPKADVVAHAAKGAGTTAVEGGRALQCCDGLRFTVQRVVREWTCHAGYLRFGRAKGGICHFQGLPYHFVQIPAQRCAANLFNDRAQHVKRQAVLKHRARLLHQGQLTPL